MKIDALKVLSRIDELVRIEAEELEKLDTLGLGIERSLKWMLINELTYRRQELQNLIGGGLPKLAEPILTQGEFEEAIQTLKDEWATKISVGLSEAAKKEFGDLIAERDSLKKANGDWSRYHNQLKKEKADMAFERIKMMEQIVRLRRVMQQTYDFFSPITFDWKNRDTSTGQMILVDMRDILKETK